MKLSLEVLTEGKQKGKLLPITLTQFLIGRDAQCHLRPASPLISKRHCVLIQRDEKLFIRDFDSTNGTIVNDQPLKGEVELKHQDRLSIGPITLRVIIEPDSPADGLRPPLTKPVTAPAKAPEPDTPLDNTQIPAKRAKKDSAKPAAKVLVADAHNSDDDMAAMMMSLQDVDTETGAASVSMSKDGTDKEFPLLPDGGEGERPKTDAEKEREKAKQNQGNTASAAKSILEKMMRRPRT